MKKDESDLREADKESKKGKKKKQKQKQDTSWLDSFPEDCSTNFVGGGRRGICQQ